MRVRPGDWMRFPVGGADPLAQLAAVIDGRTLPAFREADEALVRCPLDLAPGAYRVQVLVGGRQVRSDAVAVVAA